MVGTDIAGVLEASAPIVSMSGTKARHDANRGRGRPNSMPRDTQPSDDSDDAMLLAQVAAGAEQAFVAFYRRRSDDVFRFAYAMAKSSRSWSSAFA